MLCYSCDLEMRKDGKIMVYNRKDELISIFIKYYCDGCGRNIKKLERRVRGGIK